jgi:hypothetical protein
MNSLGVWGQRLHRDPVTAVHAAHLSYTQKLSPSGQEIESRPVEMGQHRSCCQRQTMEWAVSTPGQQWLQVPPLPNALRQVTRTGEHEGTVAPHSSTKKTSMLQCPYYGNHWHWQLTARNSPWYGRYPISPYCNSLVGYLAWGERFRRPGAGTASGNGKLSLARPVLHDQGPSVTRGCNWG